MAAIINTQTLFGKRIYMYNIEELEKIIPDVDRAGELINIKDNYAIEYSDQTFKLEAVFDQSDEEIIKYYKTMAIAPHVIRDLIGRIRKLDGYVKALLYAISIVSDAASGMSSGAGVPGELPDDYSAQISSGTVGER